MRHTFEGPHQGDVTVVDEHGTPGGPVVVYLHSEWGAFEEPPLSGELLDGARVAALALMAPWGMFDEADPGADMFALLPRDLNPLIYADPDGQVAAAQQPRPADAHETGLAVIRRVQVLGAASNYLFPIPDTGIAERLYRLAGVPVLLVWGARDGVVPPSLAGLWSDHLPHARSEVVADAAHMVPYESADARKLVGEFLTGTP